MLAKRLLLTAFNQNAPPCSSSPDRLSLLKVDNELRLIQSGAKLPLSVQAVGSLTEANLPCVLWEFAGAPLPRELSLESLPVLLKDVTAALRLLQV